ncbi:MAG: S8 family peptidase [Flavobacterium sp.]|uniref:S8 family peptidase n=1 Tax=Flavobacterium sp. TaxID=239 RepID=UPI003263B774
MKFIYLTLALIIISCTSINKSIPNLGKIKGYSETWYRKDYISNGVPGISLDKFLLKSKKVNKENQIIIAVLDTQIDTNHEDLKGMIWVNKSEIPDNNIDDDFNGYVDDVNGWNFIGTKSGNYTIWANFEYTRLIREYNNIFRDKKREEIPTKDLLKYDEYQRALVCQDRWFKYYGNYLKSLKYSLTIYPLAKDTLKYYFSKEDYTVKQLDSMYSCYKINDKSFKERRDNEDKDFGALIAEVRSDIKSNTNSFEKLNSEKIEIDSICNKNLNLNYNERKFIGDNENVLEKGYGNGKINNKIEGIRSLYGHNTKVSSIIAANVKNNIGIKGFSDNIKIMPLSISPSGDEHDKDIAMAIFYAVDNGAKIINMSFSKQFSLHPEWVTNAFRYAEKNNVLIVHISGNDAFNIDENPIYPNDYQYDSLFEVCVNFINVGSVSSKLDSTFVSSFSNYGKKNVDLFAPGENIYTAIPENKYDYDSGTSLAAPMVSGTAALIWLYYPNLSVQQVKQIILESGTDYDLEVLLPGGNGKKVPFRQLSKSGKVLNVYSAMKIAKKTSMLKNNG